MKVKPGTETTFASLKAKNTTDYGRTIIEYAERWAELMEACIAAGDVSKEMFDRTGDQADSYGLSGAMGETASSIISHYWLHGALVLAWKAGKSVSLLDVIAETARD